MALAALAAEQTLALVVPAVLVELVELVELAVLAVLLVTLVQTVMLEQLETLVIQEIQAVMEIIQMGQAAQEVLPAQVAQEVLAEDKLDITSPIRGSINIQQFRYSCRQIIMKFKIKEVTTESVKAEYEDGSWALVPIQKGQTKDAILSQIRRVW